jgi:hypothetical protein
MTGLGTRMARSLNRVMQRSGAVFADRYHSRILRTPTEVKRVRHHLLNNARKHYGLAGPDRFTSQVAVMAPDTFLLRQLCQHGISAKLATIDDVTSATGKMTNEAPRPRSIER